MKRRWRQNRGKIRRRGNEGIRRKRRKNGEKWKTWRMGNKDEEQKQNKLKNGNADTDNDPRDIPHFDVKFYARWR